ncbi:MAG: tRNA1(Val) (adenine(37)-N6)-methyltransferase [Deltaproteobacteria bacterium]|nr:tRNA1(Val) (adenine(37)-N6)-methyltransferase [Deltaproteobacteria bacterium]
MTARDDETLDAALGGALRVIQHKKGYRFSLDAVLLADFVSPARGSVVDLGTGSGVVAMIVAHRSPDARVTALELQPALADRARRSVALNRLEQRVTVVEGDVRKLELPSRSFDLVVSNPPFQAASDRVSPNSERAHARHELTYSLADLGPAAKHLLKPNGKLAVVYPATRLDEVLHAFVQLGLSPTRLQLVHPRADEPAKMFLLEASLAESRMNTLPPLVLHEPGARTYTPEAARILGERG